MAKDLHFCYNYRMANFESAGKSSNEFEVQIKDVTDAAQKKANEELGQTKKKVEEINAKFPQLERVENNPLLMMRVFVSEPCYMRLPNGMNGRLTDVPAVYFVRRRTELGVDIANANGELVGHIERSACREWNSRLVFRPQTNTDGRRLHLFSSAENCRQEREGTALPAALQRPNVVFPIYETRKIEDTTYYLVGAPMPFTVRDQIQCRFPAWVSTTNAGGRGVGEEGILQTTASRRRLADAIARAERDLALFTTGDARVANRVAIENSLAQLRMSVWTYCTGQNTTDVTQFRDSVCNRVMTNLPQSQWSVDCFDQSTTSVLRMDQIEYRNWLEHLRSSATRLRGEPDTNRFTLHSGTEREVTFLGTAGLP